MLCMISVRIMVLPTPAPPKRPNLPPWGRGAKKSMTLMPVSQIASGLESLEVSGAGEKTGRLVGEAMTWPVPVV